MLDGRSVTLHHLPDMTPTFASLPQGKRHQSVLLPRPRSLRSLAAEFGLSHETIRAVLRQAAAVRIISHPRRSLLAHSESAGGSGVFRPLLPGHNVQDPTGVLRECADVAMHGLYETNPAGVDRGNLSGPALPCCFSMKLPVAKLRDAALGLCDAWNHDVLLRAVHRCGFQRPSRAWFYPALPPR